MRLSSGIVSNISQCRTCRCIALIRRALSCGVYGNFERDGSGVPELGKWDEEHFACD